MSYQEILYLLVNLNHWNALLCVASQRPIFLKLDFLSNIIAPSQSIYVIKFFDMARDD